MFHLALIYLCLCEWMDGWMCVLDFNYSNLQGVQKVYYLKMMVTDMNSPEVDICWHAMLLNFNRRFLPLKFLKQKDHGRDPNVDCMCSCCLVKVQWYVRLENYDWHCLKTNIWIFIVWKFLNLFFLKQLDFWGMDGDVLQFMMPMETEVSKLVSASERQYIAHLGIFFFRVIGLLFHFCFVHISWLVHIVFYWNFLHWNHFNHMGYYIVVGLNTTCLFVSSCVFILVFIEEMHARYSTNRRCQDICIQYMGSIE